MALTEQTTYKQQVNGDFMFITEIADTAILRNGIQVTSTRHRGVVTPGVFNGTTYTRTDITGYSPAFQAIANALWTDDLHTAYEAHLRAQ